MKAVTSSSSTKQPMQAVVAISKLLANAKQATDADDYEQAIELYNQVLKADELNEQAYNRLMIIYRKLKLPKQEVAIINAGIKAFEKFYKPTLKSAKSKRVAEISNALLKSTGLADKKGNTLYEPEPINTWRKRKLIAEKKLKK